jgi:hypothetical protein
MGARGERRLKKSCGKALDARDFVRDAMAKKKFVRCQGGLSTEIAQEMQKGVVGGGQRNWFYQIIGVLIR